MTACDRRECQTTAGCAHRGPHGEFCWIAGELKKDVSDAMRAFAPDATIHTMFQGQSEWFGVIRLESWPEGLVLWVGGEIVWRSWQGTERKRDLEVENRRLQERVDAAEASAKSLLDINARVRREIVQVVNASNCGYTTRDGRLAGAIRGPDGFLYGWKENLPWETPRISPCWWDKEGRYFRPHQDFARPDGHMGSDLALQEKSTDA